MKPGTIQFLYTDDLTGASVTIQLREDFVIGVTKFLVIGQENAQSTADFLQWLGVEDTDGNRRHFRAALQYWIRSGVVILSSTSGYFIASNENERTKAVETKERKVLEAMSRIENFKQLDIGRSLEIVASWHAPKDEPRQTGLFGDGELGPANIPDNVGYYSYSFPLCSLEDIQSSPEKS